MVQLSDLLSSNPEDFKRPPPLPVGTYHAVYSEYEIGNSKAGNPQVRIGFNLVAPCEDVDATQLAGVDLSKSKLSRYYNIQQEHMWRLSEFLTKALGLSGRPVNVLLEEGKGRRCKVLIQQEPSQDGTYTVNSIRSVMAAD